MEQIIRRQNRRFWCEKKYQNISFTFPNSSEPNKILHANKVILAQASPVFEAMFFGDLAEKKSPIPILDADPYTFEVFLSFIYTAQLSIRLDFTKMQQLFYVANKYEVVSLETACQNHLIRNMTKYDLEDVLDFTELFGLEDLSRLCRVYMNQGHYNTRANWKPFDKTLAKLYGIFIADYDSDGWPLGVARVFWDGRFVPGTYYIKENIVCIGNWAQSFIYTENFEVLCGGSLEWVKSSEGRKLYRAIDVGPYQIGKTLDNNEVHVGRVEEEERCLFIFYKAGGGGRINNDYYHLIDTYTGQGSPPKILYLRKDVLQDKVGEEFPLRLRHDQFRSDEIYEDVSIELNDNGKSKLLKANKIILAQASPIFEDLIDKTQESAHISINVVNIKTFEALLRFIYTRETEMMSLVEIEDLISMACSYEIFCIKSLYEIFLMKNLKNFALSEINRLAKNFDMSQLLRLCELHETNNPQKNVKARWVNWKIGEPLPSGTFFAGYDKNGWPLGIAEFSGIPGTLHIKDMVARSGTFVVAYENRTDFDILCDGNLEWVPSKNGVTLPQSVEAGWQFCVGKCKQNEEIFVGKVQDHHKCMYIAFRQGESQIFDNYFHLIDKNYA